MLTDRQQVIQDYFTGVTGPKCDRIIDCIYKKIMHLKSEPITFFLRQAGSDTAGCQKKTTILLSCSGGAVVLSSLYSAIKAVYTLV